MVNRRWRIALVFIVVALFVPSFIAYPKKALEKVLAVEEMCRDSQTISELQDSGCLEKMDAHETYQLAQERMKDEQIALQRQQVSQRNRWLVVMIIICLILAAFSICIYNKYRHQRRLMQAVVERVETNVEQQEEKQKQPNNRYSELFQRVKHEVEDLQIFKDKSLSRELLASRLETNRTYITDCIKEMTGLSFTQYVNNLRVREAERIINDPTIDIANFASLGDQLGFCSLSAFQNVFKKQTGMTLSAYRKIARRDA